MTYHAIFGRTAIAKFMIVPHYAMKIPEPQGIITLYVDIK